MTKHIATEEDLITLLAERVYSTINSYVENNEGLGLLVSQPELQGIVAEITHTAIGIGELDEIVRPVVAEGVGRAIGVGVCIQAVERIVFVLRDVAIWVGAAYEIAIAIVNIAFRDIACNRAATHATFPQMLSCTCQVISTIVNEDGGVAVIVARALGWTA